jgi:hypothetical protein
MNGETRLAAQDDKHAGSRRARRTPTCARTAWLASLLVASGAQAQGAFDFDFIVGGEHGDIEAFVDDLEATVNLPIVFVQAWPLFGLEEYRVIGNSGLGSQGVIESAIDDAVAAGTLTTGGLDIEFRAETGSGQTGSIWVTCLCDQNDFESQYGVGLVQGDLAREHATGRGVLVGIIDSGLVPGVPVTDGASTSRGWTWVRPPGYTGALPYFTSSINPGDYGDNTDNDQDGAVDEGVGHGTFIASLITLVAPEARHTHYRVLDGEGACFMSEVLSALQQALFDGMHVVNLSIVPSQPSAVMAPAFKKAYERGTTVLVSSGNYGTPGIPSENPYICTNAKVPVCSAPYIVQVGATDWNDARWDGSDWGEWVDLYAPGRTYYNVSGDPGIAAQRLVAPIGVDPLNPSNILYATASGTSFATAFATGAAAGYRSTHGEWPSPEVPLGDIAQQVMDALVASSATDTTEPPDLRRLAAYNLVSEEPRNRLRAPDMAESSSAAYRRCLDGEDLGAILSTWGPIGPGRLRVTDVDLDGIVGGADLAGVLGNWGCLDP